MKTGLIVLGVIVLIVVGGIGWAIGINNQLVAGAGWSTRSGRRCRTSTSAAPT